jgi:hypothetical protein
MASCSTQLLAVDAAESVSYGGFTWKRDILSKPCRSKSTGSPVQVDEEVGERTHACRSTKIGK